MAFEVNKAAVLGAGVMGATIAGHFANAGIPCVLLDIVPPQLTPEDIAAGESGDSPAFRNRFAVSGAQKLAKAKPAALFVPENAALITTGNFEDHMSLLTDVDWIIEVIIEKMEIKKPLLQRVAAFAKPEAVITTNTSGLSINEMAESLPEERRSRFFGTHFFNPPRYMKLLEIIPGNYADPALISEMAAFVSERLGKGVVYAKDTPNFIANRIGVYALMDAIYTMIDMGLSIDEVDLLTGKIIGHPGSASFRTADLVGLDTFLHVSNNVFELLTNDERRSVFAPPEFMKKMVANGWLGGKTGGGFYKKADQGGKSVILSLDYTTMDYKPQVKATFSSVTAAQNAPDVAGRLKALVDAKDKGGEFTWRTLSALVDYACRRIPEIADDIVNIDNGMKWGFNWELGPFEKADAIGLEYWAQRWQAEGHDLPPLITNMFAAGFKSFYETRDGKRYYYDVNHKAMMPVPRPANEILIPELKAKSGGIIKENADASLIDMGDGVALLEFHTKMNAQGPAIWQLMKFAVEETERNFEGLVVGNQGEHFSAGANLMLMIMAIQEGEFDEVAQMVRLFQRVNMMMKYSKKPVVAAPHGYTFGGGTEVCLHADRIQLAAETYMGLVELGVGLIPAGGGTKEMVIRSMERIPESVKTDFLPFLRVAFEAIGMAKVSLSGEEARKIGFLRPTDKLSMSKDLQLYDAKQAVLGLAKAGYRPGKPLTEIPVMGRAGLGTIETLLWNMQEGGYVSEYDRYLALQLSRILCGGEVELGTKVSEQYLLDLELEVFMRLLGQRKTQERIQHMLRTGKPLRN